MTSIPFGQLHRLQHHQLLHAQGKLTYVGIQSEPVATVLFSSYAIAPRIELFRVFRQAGVHYGNDDLGVTPTFTVRTEQLKDVIHALGQVPASQHSKVTAAWASVMIMPDVAHPSVFEALLTRAGAESFVRDMRTIVGSGNAVAQWILDSFIAGP